MRDERELRLPAHAVLLEELNLPPAFAQRLAGTSVAIDVLPEERAGTRRLVTADGYPVLLKKDGSLWNDYRPLRIEMHCDDGRSWRLPRHWLSALPEPILDGSGGADSSSFEVLGLPHAWDLLEVNIPTPMAASCSGAYVRVRVTIAPAGTVEVHWPDPEGSQWRIPASWRRRRIQLPDAASLVAQGVPAVVAREFAYRITTVNYHPGSMCCLPEQYRFVDAAGDKWPVRIADCVVVGFGDGPEHWA